MSEALLLSGSRVLVGPAGEFVDDGAVLVEDGMIRVVGPRQDVERVAGPGTPRRVFPDATILPGLIDSHVHLAFDSSADPLTAVAHADPARLLLGMAGRAQQLVSAGVTTARDLGDRDALSVVLRDAIAAGTLAGPRILAATSPLTCPGGHCGFLGGEVGTDAEIRERIKRVAAEGADLVKVMASGGALTPGGPKMWEPQFTAAQLRLIVAQAAGHGLGVAAHAHGTDTIAHCVEAGVRTLEHCSWRVASGLRYDHDLAREIAARRIGVCRCVSGDWRLFLTQLGRNADALVDSILRMREAGVLFIAGTDAGVPGARFDDYVGMLEFFAELGFGNAEIVDMATVNAAEALDLRDTGRLAAGLRADVLVVRGDPLTELSALRDVALVLTAGRVHIPG
ncbi:amidohydrolase family protein [Amycolatopsis sp. NPDC059027]|uniref:amidohydrolase family protein n=1 Tax=Amycolatopsis sp. NPDC059027 TaxID=3346709 RepID=UPI0036701734